MTENCSEKSSCSSLFPCAALTCVFFHHDSTLISRTSLQAGMMGWHSVLLCILSFRKLLIIINLTQLVASRTLSWPSPWLSEYHIRSPWSAFSSFNVAGQQWRVYHSSCRSCIISLHLSCQKKDSKALHRQCIEQETQHSKIRGGFTRHRTVHWSPVFRSFTVFRHYLNSAFSPLWFSPALALTH